MFGFSHMGSFGIRADDDLQCPNGYETGSPAKAEYGLSRRAITRSPAGSLLPAGHCNCHSAQPRICCSSPWYDCRMDDLIDDQFTWTFSLYILAGNFADDGHGSPRFHDRTITSLPRPMEKAILRYSQILTWRKTTSSIATHRSIFRPLAARPTKCCG
jgi:hypothetical protein